jgi:hypothetical protein
MGKSTLLAYLSSRLNRRKLLTRAAPVGVAGTMLGAFGSTPAAEAQVHQADVRAAISAGRAPEGLNPHFDGGVQFTPTIPAKSSQIFFTFGWPYDHPVLWTLLPVDAPVPDSDKLALTSVATTSHVDNGNRTIVYWLTITNSGNTDRTVRGIFIRFSEINV